MYSNPTPEAMNFAATKARASTCMEEMYRTSRSGKTSMTSIFFPMQKGTEIPMAPAETETEVMPYGYQNFGTMRSMLIT